MRSRFAKDLRRNDRDSAVEKRRPHRVAARESQPVRLGHNRNCFGRGSRTGNQHFQNRSDSTERRNTKEQRQVAPPKRINSPTPMTARTTVDG